MLIVDIPHQPFDTAFIVVGRDRERHARQQRREHFLYKDVKGTDRVLQHNIVFIRVKLLLKSLDIMQKVLMRHGYALRLACRAGGIEDIREAVFFHILSRKIGILIDSNTAVNDDFRKRFYYLTMFCIRDDAIRLRFFRHIRDTLLRKGRLHGNIRRAAFQHGKNRRDHFDGMIHHHADPACTFRQQNGNRIDQQIKFLCGQGSVHIKHNRLIGILFDRFLKRIVNAHLNHLLLSV